MREHPDSPIAPERRAAWDRSAVVSRTMRRSACAACIDTSAPTRTFEISLGGGRRAALHACGPCAVHARGPRIARSRCTGSKATAAACGCRFSTPPAAAKRTAAAAICTTRSKARTSASPAARHRARLQLRVQPVVRVRRAGGRARCRRLENRLPYAVTAGEMMPLSTSHRGCGRVAARGRMHHQRPRGYPARDRRELLSRRRFARRTDTADRCSRASTDARACTSESTSASSSSLHGVPSAPT